MHDTRLVNPLTTTTLERVQAFRHDALLHSTTEEFVHRAASFVREAVVANEAVLVMIDSDKTGLLRAELRDDDGPQNDNDQVSAQPVVFAEVDDVANNPARLMSMWLEFVDEHAGEGRTVRGFGESIWPSRSLAQRGECHIHEAILNHTFGTRDDFWLMCAYDVSKLPGDTVAAGMAHHPHIVRNGTRRTSDTFRAPQHDSTLGAPMDPPPENTHNCTLVPVGEVRRSVDRFLGSAGFSDVQRYDFVLAVSEVISNSLQYGGGIGDYTMWIDDDVAIFESSDRGVITDPLLGLRRPSASSSGGRGLWLANHLCDLVQLRSTSAGSRVRMHMRRRP